MIRKISAHYVFPVTNPPVKYGIIVCSTSGEILDIIDCKGVIKEIASLEFYDGILIPGFIKDDSQTDEKMLEKMRILMNENPAITLDDVIKMTTWERAKKMNCEHTFGSIEKHKCPGVNLISGIDFAGMRLTNDSRIRTLVPPCKVSNHNNSFRFI